MREMDLPGPVYPGGKGGIMRICAFACSLILVVSVPGAAAERQQNIVLADFEGGSYGEWRTTGTAFGRRPAF